MSKIFYNPDIQTVIKIQKRCINVYDFVTYLEIRDDLSEEDKQYINSEIKKNMAKYHMEKDGIKYYVHIDMITKAVQNMRLE